MKNNKAQEIVSQEDALAPQEYWAPKMPKVLHTLSNKLLPIVAFSDLGFRRCDDPKLREYFDKIRQAAADSRDLLIQLRQQVQQSQKAPSEKNRSLPDDASSDE